MEKSIFNFKIQYMDGTVIDLHEDKNLWVSSFRILSPDAERETDEISGRHGSIPLGKRLKERKVTTSIQIEAYDPADFDLFRDEIFEMFNPLNEFYVIRDIQPGKRMKVSVSSEFDIDYVSLEDGVFDVDFVIDSVFLESIGTTKDLFEWDEDLWQFGMGIPYDNYEYEHSTNDFVIYNAGNVDINPRNTGNMDILIEIKATASNYIELTNKTTGDVFRYDGSLTQNDILRLDGIRVTKNQLSVYRDTNKRLITLVPKENIFEVKGAVIERISFIHRFYYL